MVEFCCRTHWATVLVVNSNHLAQSHLQRLCNLHLAEQSRQDQVSTCFKGLLPRVKGHPCQTSWAHSGGSAWTHKVVGWGVSAHVFYSSNPDPQHHARVWMSEIQIRIHCKIPCVTCMPFGRISSRPTCVIFIRLGRTYQTCIKIVHAVQSHFRNDRDWQTLPQEDLVECSLVIITSPSMFSCLARPSL